MPTEEQIEKLKALWDEYLAKVKPLWDEFEAKGEKILGDA